MNQTISETVSIRQAAAMMDFLAEAIDGACQQAGGLLRECAKIWVNGEAYILTSVTSSGDGVARGPVLVDFSEVGGRARFTFTPKQGRQAIFLLERR